MEPNYKKDRRIRANRTDDPIMQLHDYDVDLQSNHIYLTGIDRGYDVVEGTEEPGVEFVMANRFIKNMNLCMRVNPDTPIVIHLKTCGGDWQEGMAIYDTIKSCPFPVTILNYTHARSMSSIILQAADKRVMMPHSVFMFHDGTFGMWGTQKQVESTVDFYRNTRAIMLGIYSNAMASKWPSKTKAEAWLKKQMAEKEDVYLTAQDTVKYGLADSIFDYNWKSLTQF